MSSHRVPAALRERIGLEATTALLDFVDAQQQTWSDRVLSIAAERFERRLTEQIAELRVALVREIHDGRVEMLKWGFVFWIGQVAAVAALLAFLVRTARP